MFSWCEWGISQFVRDIFPLKFNLIFKSYRPAVINNSYKPLRTASFGLVRLIYCILRFSVIVCFSKCSVVDIGHAMMCHAVIYHVCVTMCYELCIGGMQWWESCNVKGLTMNRSMLWCVLGIIFSHRAIQVTGWHWL